MSPPRLLKNADLATELGVGARAQAGAPHRRPGRPWRENRAVLRTASRSSVTAPHGPIFRTGIPPIKRATGGFSSGCARVCCGAFSRSSPRLSTTKAIWICRSLHRWELRTAKQGGAGVGKTKRGRARRSWRSPIAADSPSRFTSRVPRRTKSPWSTQPSRSGLSSRSLASHRGQRLRVGPPRCRPGPPRRGTDRPAPQNTNIADPRRSPAA